MRKLFFFAATLISTFSTLAQTGSIRGIVIDANTRETLTGTNVLIQSTLKGTTTDLDGQFRLTQVEPGNHTIVISFISYETVTVENVRIEPGKETTLNMELKPATQQLEGVTIAARRLQHTDIALLSSIRTSELVVSGISAQQISRSQDRDAAQIVRRIPGVVVMEGRFINIRGLEGRYNYVFLNEATAPSMEPDVRSFAFDIIPSSQLERIMIYKSAAPDLPGDFSGGVVKIYTRSIPEKTGFDFSLSSSYEPGSTFKDFYSVSRGPRHWTGLNQGEYDLTAGFPKDIRSVKNDEELQRLGQSFKNNWVPEKMTSLPNIGGSANGSFRFKIFGVEVGNITSLNYSNSKTYNFVVRNDYSIFDLERSKSLPLYRYDDNQYQQSIKAALMHNWGVKFSPRHSIEFKNLFNQITSYQYILRNGENYDFEYFPNTHSFQHVYRGLYSGQLSGKHDFFEGNTRFDWLVGRGSSYRDMPDYKRFRSDLPEEGADPTLAVIYVPIGGAQPYFMGRFYSNMNETQVSYSGNITQNIRFTPNGWFKPQIKAGFYIEKKNRTFVARNIGYTQAVNFNQNLMELPISDFFAPVNINNNGGVKIDEQSNPNDSYDAGLSVNALYGMINLPITPKLKLVTGIRYEKSNAYLLSATTDGPIDKDYPANNILPSINLSYNFSDKMLVRAAYGKTLNRPEFRERAPFGFYDFDKNLVISGNVFLKNASIHNYDLRWEWYPTISEMVTFGFFYKTFSDPIEKVFVPGAGSGGSKNFTFNNAESAASKGVEIEIRKSLIDLTDLSFIHDISIISNVAFIRSNIKVGSGSLSGRDTENRPMQGQSPYIVNAGLYYDNEEHQLQLMVIYNLVGKRIYGVGYTTLDRSRVEYPDPYEMPRDFIDITATKSFKSGFYIKAGVTDLLNQKIYMLQDANESGKLVKGNDQTLEGYNPGTLYTLTLGIKR